MIEDKADPNLRILSDEYYETILFDGRKHESVLSVPGMAERTILLSGHSKMYAMTGWRIGFAVLPSLEEALAFRLCTINNYSCGIPFVQMAAKAAMDNDENLAIIEDMRRQFEERRDVVVDALNQIEGISCVLPGGAFYAFPNVHGACVNIGAVEAFEKLPPEKQAKTSASEFFQRFALFKHGVAALDRKGFCRVGSEGQHYLSTVDGLGYGYPVGRRKKTRSGGNGYRRISIVFDRRRKPGLRVPPESERRTARWLRRSSRVWTCRR